MTYCTNFEPANFMEVINLRKKWNFIGAIDADIKILVLSLPTALNATPGDDYRCNDRNIKILKFKNE
jgi:hypothetical protein